MASLPSSPDKDFDSLYTIGGEILLITFCALPLKISRDNKLISFIEEVRQKRNKAVHGTTLKDISTKYIIENILKTFTIWFGKDAWHKELKKNILKNPLFGYIDVDYESKTSYKFLDFALTLIGRISLQKHLSLNIKGHAYFCPECKHDIDKDYGTLESKWAFLNPNEPTSTKVSCSNCHQTFDVKREECNIKECKGNVLFDDKDYTQDVICLTCFERHEYE
ncbi:uncharacterized protein YlaI [Chitinophaga sp. W3I9]|uniref:hypothetical protein n=1 Tax=Chitinophaga sp. W3I9 TaxID=3373924 RepID=UPI003D238499